MTVEERSGGKDRRDDPVDFLSFHLLGNPL